MPKIHIAKSEANKRAEERRTRVAEVREKGNPTNKEIVQMLADIWDELQEIKKKI